MSKSQRGTGRATRPTRPTTVPPSTPARLRRRHPMLFTLLPVALVLLAIVTMVVIKTAGGSSGPSAAASTASASRLAAGGNSAGSDNGTSPLPSGVLSEVTSVSPATLAAVGSPGAVPLPVKIPGSQILRAADGKPEIVYIGAEYCPFCAAERWALVQALSRFGTFTGLSATHSSGTDVYPNTQTFSFFGSTYTSPYLDFTPVEEQSNQPAGGSYATLQTPTAAENALLAKYDVAPYTSEPGSIPFLDLGNRYVVVGASYTPQVLQGLNLRTIAADLNQPNSVVATAIDGAANAITAGICALTGNQPASVCSTPTIAAIVQKLGS
jgi:hypothetical protein